MTNDANTATDQMLPGVVTGALALLSGEVAQIKQDEWDKPSGLDEWTLGDLVAHVTGSITKLLAQVQGTPLSARPSAPDEFRAENPSQRLSELSQELEAALPAADFSAMRPSPGGEMPLRNAVAFPLTDTIVHAWDVANACGRDLELPAPLLGYVRAFVDALPEKVLRDPGAFGPAQTPPANSNSTLDLMAYLGRSPRD